MGVIKAGTVIREQWIRTIEREAARDEYRRHERQLRDALTVAGLTGDALTDAVALGMIDRDGCPVCAAGTGDQIDHILREHRN